jgi:hypothetical protein
MKEPISDDELLLKAKLLGGKKLTKAELLRLSAAPSKLLRKLLASQSEEESEKR